MAQRRKIEIFTAGCPTCSETAKLVERIAGSNHDIDLLDMHRPDVASLATRLGVRSLPAIVIDGQLAGCCSGRGPDEAVLRQAIG